MTGIILAFGADKKSRFAGLLMITTVQAVSVWNIGIKTAAAQNMWLSASSSTNSARTSPG